MLTLSSHLFTDIRPKVRFSKWISVEGEALINAEPTAWFRQRALYWFLACFHVFLFTATLLLTSKLKCAWTLRFTIFTRETSKLNAVIFFLSDQLKVQRNKQHENEQTKQTSFRNCTKSQSWSFNSFYPGKKSVQLFWFVSFFFFADYCFKAKLAYMS